MFINPQLYIQNKPWQRIPGIIFLISGIVYLYWLFNHINSDSLAISVLFLIVQVLSFIVVTFSVINTWKGVYRTDRPKINKFPPIGVIIPTYREKPEIVEDTARSCLAMDYPGKIVVLISNDDQRVEQVEAIKKITDDLAMQMPLWKRIGDREIHSMNTIKHNQAKAGNLNQALAFLVKIAPQIELLITQDADEIIYPDFLKAIVGYFEDSKVAYVQTIKQSVTDANDPFGNQDRLFYCRTSACRDADNAMLACGSGVMWRIAAVNEVGGFNTWNLVEDLTTSYQILAKGWQSRFHYESLSHGLAPEDLPNFIKQRGTWALDTMRLFWWDNPIFKKGLSLRQKIHFLEPCAFYLNGFVTVGMIMVTSLSLWFRAWPTSGSAWEHGFVLLPYFLSMEAYFLILAGEIPFFRVRQLWIGLSPIYIWASIVSLLYGPNKKPVYKVTRKENIYSNYIYMVWPQLLLLGILISALAKTLMTTPLYSAFDWGTLFWGIYLGSFLIQIIKLSWWAWSPIYEVDIAVINNKIFPWFKSRTRAALEEISPVLINQEKSDE